jgi:hypothetical protein
MDIKRYKEVLNQIDSMATHPDFPAFGSGFCYIDSRMSIYADERYWGILIETVEVNINSIGHSRNLLDINRYGNNMCGTLGFKEDQIYILTSDGDDGPLFVDFDLNPNVKTMRLRGHLVPIPRDPLIYKSKGMQLIDKNDYDPKESFRALEDGRMIGIKDEIWPEVLLRAMTPEYREYFFLSEEEKQAEFLQPIPQILQLEEWRHPILSEEGILEKPSTCETFQLIAKVIATCDPSLYKPTEKPNTHWSNWLIADKCL